MFLTNLNLINLLVSFLYINLVTAVYLYIKKLKNLNTFFQKNIYINESLKKKQRNFGNNIKIYSIANVKENPHLISLYFVSNFKKNCF